MIDDLIINLIEECKRQEKYTSITLYEWLKSMHLYRSYFVVIPIVLGESQLRHFLHSMLDE